MTKSNGESRFRSLHLNVTQKDTTNDIPIGSGLQCASLSARMASCGAGSTPLEAHRPDDYSDRKIWQTPDYSAPNISCHPTSSP
ncbi:hypothetical protein J7T55_007687 [Diaporthe amygdali]|uniref:uncharacterized protein n=1 Tax=Phomopsis amygdali TaxID=1214568 RepID=UPI0022FE2EED|nr:uncharacterized protein J7T55_007687 [Diaporthe amygdali]KAJ0107498.1 hypothetical protein J7T55_007687 [Diaporthe amygdali]